MIIIVNSIGAGVLSDIYVVSERGRALGFYFLGILIGPAIGPSKSDWGQYLVRLHVQII